MSLRIALAGLLTFGLSNLLGLAGAMTAVLTSVIVMQASVGGALTASRDRILSTTAGGLWSVLVTLVLPQHMAERHLAELVFGLTPLACLAAFQPSYRVAPVTAIIVLLNPVAGQAPVISALDRLAEIVVGTAVAMAVALFVLPGKAQGLFIDAASTVLEKMAQLCDQYEQKAKSKGQPASNAPRSEAGSQVHLLHDSIRSGIAKMEALAGEANRERNSHLSSAPDPLPFLRATRRLYHDLAVLERAAGPVPEAVDKELAQSTLEGFQALAQRLRSLSKSVSHKGPSDPSAPVAEALRKYQSELTALNGSGKLQALSGTDMDRVFSFAFMLEQLRIALNELGSRGSELMP